MPNLKELVKKNKKTIIILSIIVLLGIFLRTYKFHDWLRFSRDQVRDVSLIDNALEGKDHLPLLGPNAGTTKFRLGPIYYYFSYASEKMFGDYPDKMAYPSVFFSILSIPLLFFFLKEFFNDKISLAMTSVMSVSYFLIINSRFSSNPNLITFFGLLYLDALLKILNDPKGRRVLVWSALAGISMGVSIQLHTTLLIVMPIVTLCALAYIFFKNKSANIWKIILTIVVFFLILNTSQIISEFDSHGQNTKYFIKGFGASSSSSKHLGKEFFLISACQIEANTHMITSLQSDEACNTVFQLPKDKNKYSFYFGMSLSVLFSIAGYFLLGKRFKEEKEIKKKHFLGLIIFFNLISFLILVPIANIIFVGYFINLFFIPLVLLGLMVEFIQNKYPRAGTNVSMAVIAILILSSMIVDAKAANSYLKGLENNDKNSTLSEVESISGYILSTYPKQFSKQYLAGQTGLAERFFRPVNYFTENSGVETNLLKAGDEKKVEQENVIYYLKKNDSNEIIQGQIISGHEIISGKKLSGLTILILKR